MRGVVSLATALSMPLLMNDGTAFPHRDLIIFITFVVIFITLVFQGLTLPYVIKLTKIGELDPVLPSHEQHAGIRLQLDTVALQHLSGHYGSAGQNNGLVKAYAEKLKNEIEGHKLYLSSEAVCINSASEREEFQRMMYEIHTLQRKELFKMKNEKTYTDDEIRKAEHLLDINDMSVSES